MTALEGDPFAEPQPRDGNGRAQIIPLVRNKPNLKAKLESYTRVSTFAKALDNGAGLTDWKRRHAALGIACNPDLAAMAGALGRDLNEFTQAQKVALDEIIETAHDRSGGNAKANYGTAIHSLTEPGNDGFTPDQMAADVKAYTDALGLYGLVPVATEQFVVNDELKCAGTFDHIYEATRTLRVGDYRIAEGDRFVGDKKTGRLSFLAFAIQLAVYANAKLYDPQTGERSRLNVSTDYGIAVSIARGEGKCELYIVNLTAGYEASRLAGKVRATVSRPKRYAEAFPTILPIVVHPLDFILNRESVEPIVAEAEYHEADMEAHEAAMYAAKPDHDDVNAAAALLAAALGAEPIAEPIVEPADQLMFDIHTAPDRDACAALWRGNKPTWTPAHQAAVVARLAELDAAA